MTLEGQAAWDVGTDPGVWRMTDHGYATGLDVAEALARVPASLEVDRDRVAQLLREVEAGRIAGDAARVGREGARDV